MPWNTILMVTGVTVLVTLMSKIGGGSLLALISTIVVAGHLTDMSPLSTTGAVFIAQAGEQTDKPKIFRDMMLWGLSMSVVGAVISWLFFTVLQVP